MRFLFKGTLILILNAQLLNDGCVNRDSKWVLLVDIDFDFTFISIDSYIQTYKGSSLISNSGDTCYIGETSGRDAISIKFFGKGTLNKSHDFSFRRNFVSN